ncbi:MAG: DUF4418 family protein [Clostridiales bacterium]|nr:DUF4418 family protein [Candidatus Crickella merdequi]
MKNKIISILQLVASVALLGAVKIWAPVCSGLVDMSSGMQAHMKCWYSGQTETCLIILTIIMVIAAAFMESKPRKLMEIAIIAACIIMFMVVGPVIGICAKAEMACRKTAMWVRIMAAVISVLGLVELFSGKKNQIPD